MTSLSNMLYLVVFTMTTLVMHTSYGADMNLSCKDNATCINSLADQLVEGIRNNRSVRVFNMFTIEPMESAVEEGRSSTGSLARFFNSHSIKFDFGQYGIRVARATAKDASLALDIEKNVSPNGEGRGRSKKMMQVLLPLVLGMKTASTLVVAIAAVALLTFKAFVASKLALVVTISMVVKKFLEKYSGFGGMNHGGMNYMHPQYPVDFSSAGVHPGYSMGASGIGSHEYYGLSGVANQQHEPIHPSAPLNSGHDASGQYSQNVAEFHNPNNTSKFVPTAGKRWDAVIRRKPMYYDSHSGNQEYNP